MENHVLRAIPSTIHSRVGGWGGLVGYITWNCTIILNMHSLQAGVNKNLPASLKYLQAFSSQ